jgi:hypothetical protein
VQVRRDREQAMRQLRLKRGEPRDARVVLVLRRGEYLQACF